MKKLTLFGIVVPASAVVLSAILTFTGITAPIESGIFDSFLRGRQAPFQHKEILLVEVDDPAVSTIGTWPISRSITADALMLMGELGAKSATFDIEYLDKSPRGVDSSVLTRTLPKAVNEATDSLLFQVRDLVGAFASGDISLRDAPDYLEDFAAYVAERKSNLQDEIGHVALDNDLYMAQALHFFGNAHMTINMQNTVDSNVSDAQRQKALKIHAINDLVTDRSDMVPNVEILPVISPMLDEAAGIGFTNVDIDEDGVRRRVRLFARYGDSYFPQLAMGPLLVHLGNPKIVIETGSFKLLGAKMPDGSTRDIEIPRLADGSVLIDWPQTRFRDSFRHISLAQLYLHDQAWEKLMENLRIMDTSQILSTYQGEVPLLEQNDQAEYLKKAIMAGEESNELVPAYRGLKDKLLAELGSWLDGKPDLLLNEEIDKVLAMSDLGKADKEAWQKLKDRIPEYFSATRAVYASLMEYRSKLAKELEGSFCIIGQTNTGSTDLGKVPFEKEYPNVGTHASTANMILNRSFLTEQSSIWSLLLALLIAYGLLYLSRNMSPLKAILAGTGVSVAAVIFLLVVFVATGAFFPVFAMGLPIVLSFVAMTFIKFMVAEQEKGFLRNAFSRYLSDAVIKQIVADPGKLQLGGQQKYMTAMFTDIKGFSTISEKMTPTELVALLNRYLTGMSDLVLEAGGTIDKYEGDAIIAFFGAPLDLPDHAKRACLTAVRMKRKEAELNAQFMAEGIAPNPLMTRIGLNSGDMVVGNMGTTKKMDYTIIGDSVNLAARLEGVNKQYGTWVCVSEDTVKDCGDIIVFRKLDRIRVVGKSQPIRIYDAIEEPDHLSPEQVKMLDEFHLGLEFFETREWTKALEKFKAGLELVPGDGPCQRYINKCLEYQKTPPPEKWDGIFTLDMK